MSNRRKSRVDRRKQNADSLNQDRRAASVPNIHIQFETKEPNLIVNLIGSITIENGTPVKEAIMTAQRPNIIKRVLVNLNKVAFIDSTAISYFLELKKFLSENNKMLILINPSPFIKNALDILNLDNVFDIREINVTKKDENNETGM